MASSMKFLCILGLILLIGTVVDGAGECGNCPPDNEAKKLASCAEAAQDVNVAVPGGCCAQLRTFNSRCLCAVIFIQSGQISRRGSNDCLYHHPQSLHFP
uniref:Bifunctional inhibitor/plant lipid transfer protein/seed storage helical domain-containing protein n=1 Tax=Noccaea caerulescens TaxID=107243 RepID=A0A1J3JJ24_NOCCA